MPLSLYHGLWGGGMRVPALAKFNWSADGNLPLDVRFFNEVLRNGTEAGMVMFEQDYICSSTASTSKVVRVYETVVSLFDAQPHRTLLHATHTCCCTALSSNAVRA